MIVGDEIRTPHGPARIRIDHPATEPASLLVLGHGAGGDVDAPDLVAVRDAAVAVGVLVASVTQPYRVAGRRAPAPAGQLDTAWQAVIAVLRERFAAPALIVGGRSSGARVACRTAVAVNADGVLALAFPLRPPVRRGNDPARASAAERARAAELHTGLPTLVVNGDRDPFGVPDPAPQIQVEIRPGERHDLRRDPAGTAAAVVRWLRSHGWAR
ncbi:MAG TPA: alpha/beta family hydrolase [Micromonosporaceae bacterium]